MTIFLLHDVLFDDIEHAKDTLDNLGYEYKTIEKSNLLDDNVSKLFSSIEKDEVIPFLSIRNARLLQSFGVNCNTMNFYNSEKYKQSKYMKYFGKYMLNDNCVFLPFCEVKRRDKTFFENLHYGSDIFIRPESGAKTFTGQVLKIDDWENELDLFLKTYNPDDNDLVAISNAKTFCLPEFRFWISDKIITYSSYSFQEYDFTKPDQNMIDFVNDYVIPLNKMDDIIVVDIVGNEDGFYSIVEVNCVTTSGTYSCDLKNLFTEMYNKSKELS